MLTEKMAYAFFEKFGRLPFFLEPSNTVVVEDDDGNIYEITDTEEAFLARVERSETVGVFVAGLRRLEQDENVLY